MLESSTSQGKSSPSAKIHFMNYISSERETNKTADRGQEESLVKDEEEVFHKRYTKRIK